ncbi:MAG: (d)CMP kinase [Sandaracinaceae bacterium]|nr:(d)CMP kinase [Sandaracinaceae bacterium]
MKRSRPVVAIDGPAGAGKSTCAGRLANRLGYVLVDTGALYRGVALAAAEAGISFDDGPRLGELTRNLPLRFAPNADGPPKLMINDIDRSADIRTPEISKGASDVSKHAEVRDALLGLQRKLGEDGGVVLEGRDIGTVVFPDAEVKIFLTASEKVRGERRWHELRARGVLADRDQTVAEVAARDLQDSQRPVAPLKPASDAIHVDTSEIDLEAAVSQMESIVRAKLAS